MEIKRFEYPSIPLYKKGKFIDWIGNDVELASVQLEICKENSDEYEIVWDGQHIAISKDGELAYWPKGLYDDRKIIFSEIAKIKSEKT